MKMVFYNFTTVLRMGADIMVCIWLPNRFNIGIKGLDPLTPQRKTLMVAGLSHNFFY